jgi:hypothetical protein
LACQASPSAAPAVSDPYLDQLIVQATTERLAETAAWRALVHYRANLLFPGVTGQADDPAFYLAPDGKTDPEAELHATLRAFFAPPLVETDTLQHPQCRFIARYHWLRDALKFDPGLLPPQPCARFHRWRDTLNASALTLVFPSAYINNPSSMFGHTLLRVDAADQDERTRLLAYAVNYAVGPGADGGTLFILKSLVGAYPGTFSLSPYYVKVKEYSDMENRDIWEYRLNFTQEEIDRLLMHAWELGPTRFDYYFFDENCAYYLLSLFEVARPGLELTDAFRGWVIPVDTVRRVVEQPGMLAQVVYRPANNTRLKDTLAHMSPDELQSVRRLAQGGGTPGAELTAVTEERRAVLLEGAYALLRYEVAAGHPPPVDTAALSRELLLARSRLPVRLEEELPMPSVRPDQGHGTRRLSLGVGRTRDADFQVLAFRPAYNDLLDPAGGYAEGAQINFLDTVLRHYREDGGLEVDKLTLVDIYSLAPRDAFIKPISWRINTGFIRAAAGGDERAPLYRTNGGAGLAWGDWDRVVFSVFVEGTLDVGDVFDPDYALGAGPALSLFVRPYAAWKINLSARRQVYYAGDTHAEREVTLEQSFSFGRRQALRWSLSDRHERGAAGVSSTLLWQWYF